jgi:hypothetical protein
VIHVAGAMLLPRTNSHQTPVILLRFIIELRSLLPLRRPDLTTTGQTFSRYTHRTTNPEVWLSG